MRTLNASLYVLSISTSHRHLEHVAHAGFAVSGRLHVFAQEELWIGRHLSTLPVCHMFYPFTCWFKSEFGSVDTCRLYLFFIVIFLCVGPCFLDFFFKLFTNIPSTAYFKVGPNCFLYFRIRRVSPLISRGLSLLASSWRMEGPCLITTSRRSPLSTWC